MSVVSDMIEIARNMFARAGSQVTTAAHEGAADGARRRPALARTTCGSVSTTSPVCSGS
ncbi:MAG: hypothetical protein IPQ07_17915 [Myxococcales bacterium]|nr:hypothetical protein [Myxococcales bacterium]